MIRFKHLASLLAAALSLVSLSPVAQELSQRPITIIVGFGPGSPTDVIARALGTDLAVSLKQPVIVENRPGAGQIVAASFLAKAAHDGHTLFLTSLPNVVAPSIQGKLAYAGYTDFAAVARVLDIGLLLATSSKVPSDSLAAFAQVLKEQPGRLSYGSSGVGSVNHLVAEAFNQKVGAKAVHVPYKGANLVVQDLLAGQIECGFVTAGAMEHVASGRLTGLAIGTTKRDPKFPNLPTFQESGYGELDASVGYVVLSPKGTPAGVVDRLNSAINQVVATEAFASKVNSFGGVQMRSGTPEQATKYVADSERSRNAFVKRANIALE